MGLFLNFTFLKSSMVEISKFAFFFTFENFLWKVLKIISSALKNSLSIFRSGGKTITRRFANIQPMNKIKYLRICWTLSNFNLKKNNYFRLQNGPKNLKISVLRTAKLENFDKFYQFLIKVFYFPFIINALKKSGIFSPSFLLFSSQKYAIICPTKKVRTENGSKLANFGYILANFRRATSFFPEKML